jgi:3-phenylpropionate/trans-cinnamate dioxygenase ferredoxin subunit
MTRCRVAALTELQPGGLRAVLAEGVPICLARLADGQVFAVRDECTHEQVELSDGDLQGEEIECPAHSSRFDVRSGSADGFPAEEDVDTYPVSVDGDDIYVEV